MTGRETGGRPEAGAPKLGRLEAGAPKLGGTEVSGPKFGGPELGAPELGGPEAGAPKLDGPELGAPKSDGPELGGPKIDGPKLDRPELGAPKLHGPKLGDELVSLEIPVTRTLIVAGALASRDYQDVHHDAESAREKGSPDVFMNILTTNGLVGRYVTDRFGPSAVLRRVAIRLGAPNYPGDTMVLSGTVTALGEDGTVEVSVVGANGLGRHVTGTVTVSIPVDVTLPEGSA